MPKLPEFTFAIKANDPDRYVPASWRFDVDPDMLLAFTLALEAKENVTVTAVFDERGRDMKIGT